MYCMLYAVRVARYLGGGSCMRCVSSCLESSLADGDTLQPLAWLLCFGTLISWGASSGCHRAAGALLNPENQFSRQHGTGVLLGTMLALCALTARLEAHWRWDNAYSAVSPLASLAHIHPRAPVPLCRHHGSQRLRNACCGIYCCCYVG